MRRGLFILCAGAAILAAGIGVGVYFLIITLKSKKTSTEAKPETFVTEDTSSASDATETIGGENEENPSSEDNNK